MRKVEAKLAVQATENLELKNTQSDRQVKMEKLTNDNETLLTRNKELQEQIIQNGEYLKRHDIELNDIEQYTCRNSIRLYGVNNIDRNTTSQKSIDTVVNIIINKLNLSITARYIDTAHRLGPFR